MTQTDNQKKELQKRLVLEALRSALGIVSQACNSVGISRQTFYEWKRNDPDFAQEVEDVYETAIDFAESKLFKQIESGNTTATIFFLKTKGKKRGYVETTEVINAERADVPSWWEE